MKNKDLDKIFENNGEDKLNVYLDVLLSKSKDIASESNFIALAMLIIVLLFYVAEFAQPESLQIGPISFKDINSVKVFFPLTFAFLIFRYIVLSAHKAELQKIIKEYTKKFFNYEDSLSEDILQVDDFTRLLLPFSIYNEIGKLTNKGNSKLGCFGAILILPISGFAFVPFILEYIWLKEYIWIFSTLNLTQKLSIILSIWILILSVYYLAQTMYIGIKENK